MPVSVRAAIADWPVGVLAAAALLVACWHINGLEQPSVGSGRLALLSFAAALPALLASVVVTHRRAVHAVSSVGLVVAAVGLVLGHWPFRPHLLGVTGYFGQVASDLSVGGRQWPRVLLPYDAERFPELHRTFTIALVVLLWMIATAVILLRRPLLSALLVFLPFAGGSAVYHLQAQGLRGAAMLVLTIGLLAVLRPERTPASGRRTAFVALGAFVLAAAAIGLAQLPGVVKSPALGWRQWDLGVSQGTSVSFVWDQTYGPLVRSAKAKRLLEVTSPVPSYWRATTLDTFDGIGWVSDLNLGPATGSRTASAPAGVLVGSSYQARFKNVGLDEPYLLTGEHPVSVSEIPGSSGTVAVSSSAVFRTAEAAAVGTSWETTNTAPKLTSSKLSAAGVDYPPGLTDDLVVASQTFPAWGTPNRDATARAILARSFLDPRLADWSRVYAEISKVVAGARTPYGAAVSIEAYFQRNYHYDEAANYASAARGPLPTFFLGSSRTGYCQMFSGTMAVALRLLGIPARVGEGFTPGSYSAASKAFIVTDRDAHAWVEAYFPNVGWVPFEPTPTRRLSNSDSYSSTSSSFSADISSLPQANPDSQSLKNLVKRFGGLPDSARPGGPSGLSSPCPGRSAQACKQQQTAAAATARTPVRSSWRPGAGTLIGALILLALLSILTWKLLRGSLAFLRRGGDDVARAVLADLRAFLADQGVRQARAASTPRELATIIASVYGIDATDWSSAQTRARYGPPASRSAAAVRSRREARRLKGRLRETISRRSRLRGVCSLSSFRRWR